MRSELVEALARHSKDELAIIAGARRVTWGELDRLARVHAAWLTRQGIGAGERVAVMMASSVELVAVTLAHLRTGVVHVPVNTRYRQDEVDYIVAHSGARALVTELIEGDAASWSEGPDERALAMLIYTSGTTGRPKGVMQSHRALAANIGAVMRLWEVEGDVVCLTLPLFHVHGLGLGILGALIVSNCVIRLHAKFDIDAVLADFVSDEYRATLFMGVPTMYHALLERLDARPAEAEALRSARLFTAGSAALSARDFERFRAATGHTILERYGMTETGFTLSNPYRGARRAGSVGLPIPGVEVRLEDGEIQIRGANVMDGYWSDPETTAATFTADGWFKTGDVAELDDGYFRIVGRASTDIIKSGGFKIGAREIEDVLASEPRFAELAVIGVADDKWGEVIAAVVVAKDGVALPPEDVLLAELQALVGARLADFKRPRVVRIVTALPRNAMGKVQKTALRTLFG